MVLAFLTCEPKSKRSNTMGEEKHGCGLLLCPTHSLYIIIRPKRFWSLNISFKESER